MNKQWVNGTAPLRVKPDGAIMMNIPERSVVYATGEHSGIYEEIVYRTDLQDITGWMYVGWLEDYTEILPANCVDIPDQTADPRDAEQYFMLYGIKQTNICGEACAAYLLNIGVKDILDNWKREKPGIWKSVFSKGKLRGTNYAELISIFEIYGKRSYNLTQIMTDKIIGRPRYTPALLQTTLGLGSVIAGVNIDYAGRLKPSGTPHWVVATAVHPERSGYGTIEIYNPFPNRVEIYSWAEFASSARTPAGVFLPIQAFQEYKFI